jgi:[protein-PII] uridylyltransferase
MLTVAPASRSVSPLRESYLGGKAELIRHFATTRPSVSSATQLVRRLARHVDATLLDLWEHAAMPPGAALIAVGGYGRTELYPHSDVDVVVLLPDGPSSDALRSSVEGFITACWDIGLEIASAVRTVDECIEEAGRDVTVQTALLESRFLFGSRRIYGEFRKAMARAMDPKAFLVAKTLEMRQRHTKFADTPYALEPNCKESPGGLRDLQMLIWVARAAGLGRTWTELHAGGLITSFEAKQLQRNEGYLRLVRARLHMIAGRREDRLVFDLQTAVAESFGYRAPRGVRVSELLMRRYYWAAKAVAQLHQILLLNIEERILGSQDAPMQPIDEHFYDRAGMLEVARDDLYLDDPTMVLRTFLVYMRTPGLGGLSARTLRALYNSRRVMGAAFRRDPANRATFMHILEQAQGQTHALRLMNQTSVLGRYLWVFRRIVGQMQHDLFHVYTVDQHILMVLRNVRRFFIPEHAHEYPFCSQLAGSWDKPWVLYVAALFHDVAKGRGGDHSELGAMEVRRFCRDHGIDGDDAALCEFLVHYHLTMSRIAQKEDLADPAVIDSFARLVGSERRLTALYLLTVADIRGTSPKVWNAWKGKLLEDLYRATLRALGGAKPSVDAEIDTRKQEARHDLNLHSMPAGVEHELWDTLEVSYFARHEAGEIAWHARALAGRVSTPEPVVSARPSPAGEGLQVLVYSPDQADLFARICGYFDSAGFNIQDAKIHTTRARYALDTFQVTHFDLEPGRADDGTSHHHRDLIALVEAQLARALKVAGPLPEPSMGRLSRRVKSFPVTPRVTLRPDERAQRFVLGITASDRSGLLYSIARVLARHRINLQLAKITTLGERVEDTFLIDGAELLQNRKQIEIETEILEAASP